MKHHHGRLISCISIVAFACTLVLGSAVAFADEQAPLSEDGVIEAVQVDDASACVITDDPAQESSTSSDVKDVKDAKASSESASREVQPASPAAQPVDEAVPAADSSPDAPLAAMATAETVDMYRLYNPNSGEHFYTGNWSERTNLIELGWISEGIGWVAPKTSKSPVYRLYNPNAGDHHYTLSSSERDGLARVGWIFEGIGWYSDDKMRIPILRQYNPNAKTGAHNFTSSSEENKELVEAGWTAEGVGWYAISGAKSTPTPIAGSKIYLDAGHGVGSSAKDVYDSGACGNGYEEAKLTADLVTLTAKYARELYGLDVYSNVDSNIEYWNRQADAKEHGCTSLVSIHFNASDAGGTGTESYIHNRNAAAKASELQSIMHKSLVKGMGLRDRGMKSAGLAVCSGAGTGLPGVLLEICFIDNSYDMKQYQAKKDAVARELAAGLFEAAQKGF